MGAENFRVHYVSDSAVNAFNSAVQEAKYDYGHRGYTGTIAEKSSFRMASTAPLTYSEADELADKLEDTVFSDKWGPAGCIEIKDPKNPNKKTFMFFGWASS
jgi:hypothetical protein